MVAQIQIKPDQQDQSLPIYTITCLDELIIPNGLIDIQVLHFPNDRYAIEWSKDYADQQGWHSWDVVNAVGGEVYFINTNTKEERLFGKEVNK